jgi:two-component system NtrC family response regulator
VTFCDGDVVQPEHLPARIRKRQASLPGRAADDLGEEPTASWPTLETLQKRYVSQVMERVQGNKRRAAQILGINRRTLYRWLEQDDTE